MGTIEEFYSIVYHTNCQVFSFITYIPTDKIEGSHRFLGKKVEST